MQYGCPDIPAWAFEAVQMFEPQPQSTVLADEESVLEHGVDGVFVQVLVDASQYLPS